MAKGTLTHGGTKRHGWLGLALGLAGGREREHVQKLNHPGAPHCQSGTTPV